MTLLDTTVSAAPAGVPTPAGRADLTRATLEALADCGRDLIGDLDHLDGAPLADLLELLADLDAVAGTLGLARERMEALARQSRGWARNRWADPDRGIRAERQLSSRRTWDIPRAAGRLAADLCADPETGVVDVADPKIAEQIVRRFLVFASVSSLRTTALKDAGVEYDDLVEVEARPAKVKVFRETPAPADGGAR